jgi:chromosome segregation ATPase
MAKKTTDEAFAPVDAADAQLHELRAKRRDLEVQLAAVDDHIRDAINAGDTEKLAEYQKLKVDLPKAFIEASINETTARNKMNNAKDAESLEALRAAEDERDELKLALEKRKEEFEKEVEQRKAEIEELESKVATIQTEIQSNRNLGADNEAGYRKSLAALAGVV